MKSKQSLLLDALNGYGREDVEFPPQLITGVKQRLQFFNRLLVDLFWRIQRAAIWPISATG